MLVRPRIETWALQDLREKPYDVFFASVGFESRSRYIACKHKPRATIKAACAFPDRQVCAFSRNMAWYKKAGYVVNEAAETEYAAWCTERLKKGVGKGANPLRVCVDISSMTRRRIADTILALYGISNDRAVIADFVYAYSKFSKPPDEDGPIEKAGPVADEFAGWPSSPGQPIAAIFGLGYEYERAIGVLEYLEPSRVWAMKPAGHDPRFEKALQKANETFWEELPGGNVIPYVYDKPFELLVKLEALVYGVLADMEPVLIPLGPKLFALTCMLVSCVHERRVGVWRVSPGAYAEASDRKASGVVVGLRVTLAESQQTPKSPLAEG